MACASRYALPLWSDRLGLIGKADVVEFHGLAPYPVEYKWAGGGRVRPWPFNRADQAICLAEMTGQPVPRGAVYHHGSRRRREIVFTPGMCAEVEQIVAGRPPHARRRPAPSAGRGRSLPPLFVARMLHCDLAGMAGRVRSLVAGLYSVNDD